MSTDAGNLNLSREIRMLLQIALGIFIFTVVIGILNGTDLVDFEVKELLAHVHSGTLGWITLCAIAGGMWLFQGAAGPSWHAGLPRLIAYLAPVTEVAAAARKPTCGTVSTTYLARATIQTRNSSSTTPTAVPMIGRNIPVVLQKAAT